MARRYSPLLLLWLASCHHGAAEAPVEPVLVRVSRAQVRDVQEILKAAGPLAPPPGADVRLGALVTGRLAAVLVAEGDRVKQGQVLARIEATPFRDALAQAQAQLEQAKVQHANDARKLERAQKLFAAGIAARQEVDDAQAQAAASDAAVRVATAAVSTAENQLNRSELRAPFDGLVAHVFTAAGEPVDGSGKPVLEVARTEVLELHAVIPAGSASRLVPGQPAQISVAGAGRSWGGEVIAVSPLLDASTGTATVRIRVPNPDGALKGGEMAQASILVGVAAHVLAVPQEALVPETQAGGAAEAEAAPDSGTGSAVELVDAQGRALRRPVVLGAKGGGWVEIRSGLSPGDPVIIQGAYALPDGAPVKVEEAAK